MKQNEKLKLFISYSHDDEKYINDFIKHITPLKNNGLIVNWYDRKIVPGDDYQDKIDNNLEDADIDCLFISANFLASNSCMKEKHNTFDLRRKKGIAVVPIILSTCGWLDDKNLSSVLALPLDGKPITDFNDPDKAWNNVYEGLKKVIENELKIKNLKISNEFLDFLENIELLEKAHSQKKEVHLDDIFVSPELEKYDYLREYEKKESLDKLIENFCNYSKILIAGENQSGKTTLCKKIFVKLRDLNFIPIYISDEKTYYQGKIENEIFKAYKEQYKEVSINDIDKRRVVPIIDNFHFAKKKEKHIRDLSTYRYQIIIVDDIFSLNFRDEQLISAFTHFKIIEFAPSLRNQLIEKWTHISDKKDNICPDENTKYSKIDSNTELVNTALGKIIGNGIMPAYPFFILTIISTYETFAKPLEQEITSQGYCYQALIYMYLRKQGVKNDEIGIYINFLTEFSFYFYKEGKRELSKSEFNSFMEKYLSKFNLPIKKKTLLTNLEKTKIIRLDDFNNYSFCSLYLYYFFVAKYLAEHIEANEEIIDVIVNNLHSDENAYIAIFISHHTRNDYVLDQIILNAYLLFEKYKPATLSKDELSFFDKQVNIIIKAVLPPKNETPEKERAKRLEAQDTIEGNKKDNKKEVEEEKDDAFALEMRRSIKTVEVMGSIIKNRSGSLEKTRLEEIFKEATKVHLRILASFLELIKGEEEQQEIIEFISIRLGKVVKNKEKKDKESSKKSKPLSHEKLEKFSKIIFWNMNFFVLYGFIDKIIHSLGSNQLIEIVKKVCDKENTPASFLVKHGILMWYKKNLQIDNIGQRIKDDDYSETAKRIMNFMIVNHCSMHSVGFKEKQKIEHRLGIPSQKLLLKDAKRN